MKKLILTACALLFSMSLIQAQEFKLELKDSGKKEKKQKLHVKVKDGAEPDIYVDGKKFDFSLDLIDTDMIASVAVVKGDKAIKEYNAPNGVILVTTKEKGDSAIFRIKTNDDSSSNEKTPIVIVDGKRSGSEILKTLSPDDIEKIEVFKDEEAIKKYNAPNGVIVITTKKKKD
ncbi:hypothetical protein [uncultured Winogradskyella sp.]|uniref:hypothetical protein n=1 Tax=uncultured Winogradskyella sp. TaxID=395353 RepID=UPI0026398B4C|nr:hypothetical protein [uncultured Winogradskyella sp.]